MQRLFLSYNDKFQLSFFVHAALAIDGKAEHAEAEQHHGARFGDGSGLPDKVVISAFHGVMENSSTRSTAESDRAEVKGCGIMAVVPVPSREAGIGQ